MRFLLILLLLFLVSTCDGFRCYQGEGLNENAWDTQDCPSSWCLKLSDDDHEEEYRQCDLGALCSTYGARCGPPNVTVGHYPITFPVNELCCCNTDLCNAAPLSLPLTSTTLTLTTIIYSFVC